MRRANPETPAAPGVLAAVIPAYRAAGTIERVVAGALTCADIVIVVDDACPEGSGEIVRRHFPSDRVVVLRHDVNRGVGGATKTGIAAALERGARYVVKIDADGQMDQQYVPAMVELLHRHPEVDLVKGNRFADIATVRRMPVMRLIGNSALSFLVKLSSGYWSIVDPTNGFLAMRASALREIRYQALEDRYFFEIDLLCALGVRHRQIAEFEMPAIYDTAPSSLSLGRVFVTFPGKLAARFFRRILFNYLIVEINVGSLYALLGFPLLAFAVVFGAMEWHRSAVSGIPRPAGTVILSLLLFTTGFQLVLQAVTYDVQAATRVLKRRPNALPLEDRVGGDAERVSVR